MYNRSVIFEAEFFKILSKSHLGLSDVIVRAPKWVVTGCIQVQGVVVFIPVLYKRASVKQIYKKS